MTFPWQDRAGRLSPLKLAAFIGVLLPALWIIVQWQAGWLAPKPVTEAIHQSGDWTVRLLLLTLLITPLRRIADWPKLIAIRRTLGVAAMAYALLHLSLYILDQKFDLFRVASEIVLRFYLTIGFVALAGLIALGVTSTDGAIRRLGGPRWQKLHNLVYGIAVLGLIHFFLQSKIDVTQATIMAGLFVLLMGYRLMKRASIALTFGPLVATAVAGGVLVAVLETCWYAFTSGADFWRVLSANLDLEYTIRPAWWVAATGLLVAMVALVRTPSSKATERPRRIAPGAGVLAQPVLVRSEPEG